MLGQFLRDPQNFEISQNKLRPGPVEDFTGLTL